MTRTPHRNHDSASNKSQDTKTGKGPEVSTRSRYSRFETDKWSHGFVRICSFFWSFLANGLVWVRGIF